MRGARVLFVLTCIAAAAAVASCTGDDASEAGDAGGGDASDASLDVGADAALVCDPEAGVVDESFAAPHRAIPPLPPPGLASDIVSPLTLVTVTAQNETLAPQLHAFSDALVKSEWFRTVGAPYDLQPPVASMHVQDAAAITTSMTTQTQVAQYLSGVIAANGPQPEGNLLYILYMPPGTDLGGADGFHGELSRVSATLRGDFAVIARLPFQLPGESELDTLTISTSHEIIEAATNFTGFGLQWGPAPASEPWKASIFDVMQIPDEVADVCAGTRTFESTAPDAGFYYQRVFDDTIARCGGGDSCVPHEEGPFYDVSVDQDWYAASPGQTITIPFHGWSTGPIADWRVFTLVTTGQPQCGGPACPALVLSSAIGRGTLSCVAADGGTDGIVAINNGVEGTLTVTMPATAQSGNYFVVPIFSLLGGDGPRGCDTPTTHDYYHLWPIGVYVP